MCGCAQSEGVFVRQTSMVHMSPPGRAREPIHSGGLMGQRLRLRCQRGELAAGPAGYDQRPDGESQSLFGLQAATALTNPADGHTTNPTRTGTCVPHAGTWQGGTLPPCHVPAWGTQVPVRVGFVVCPSAGFVNAVAACNPNRDWDSPSGRWSYPAGPAASSPQGRPGMTSVLTGNPSPCLGCRQQPR